MIVGITIQNHDYQPQFKLIDSDKLKQNTNPIDEAISLELAQMDMERRRTGRVFYDASNWEMSGVWNKFGHPQISPEAIVQDKFNNWDDAVIHSLMYLTIQYE